MYAAGMVLLVMSWWQPMHLRPWLSWHSEMLAFISFLLIAASAIRDFRHAGNRGCVRVPYAMLPLLVLMGFIALQFSIGLIGFAGDLFVLVFYLSMGVVAFTAGFNASGGAVPVNGQQLRSQPYIDWFAKAVLVAAVGSVILALVQALGVWGDAIWINRTFSYRRPGGNLGQVNQLATLAIMGIASLGYLYETKKLGSTASVTLLGILLLGVGISESRTGVLSVLTLVMWWYAGRRNAALKVSGALVIAGCAFLFAMVWVWPKFIEYVQSGGSLTAATSAGVNLSAGLRLIVWPQLIAAALQRPWLGWGVGEVAAANNAVLHNYPEGDPFTYAHNIVLDLVVGVGFPLAILFVIITTVWMRRRLGPVRTLMPWYCVALIIPVGVHSMFEFPFTYSYFLLPALFAAGLIEGVAAPAKALSLRWQYAALVIITATVALVWSAVEYVALEEDYRVARFEILRVGGTPVGYERPITHLLTQLDALTVVSRITPTPGMSSERMEIMRKVAMHYPWYAAQNRYALSLALNGNPEEAIRQLKVMRAMHGEKAYAGIRIYWKDLATSTYPELGKLQIP